MTTFTSLALQGIAYFEEQSAKGSADHLDLSELLGMCKLGLEEGRKLADKVAAVSAVYYNEHLPQWYVEIDCWLFAQEHSAEFGRFMVSKRAVNNVAPYTGDAGIEEGPGFLYLNTLYIHDIGRHAKLGHRYVLTIANCEHFSDELEALEPILFRWAHGEGYFEEE